MNKYLCSIILLLGVYAFAKAQSQNSQNTITVTVVSQLDQEPLLGANVFIKSLKKGSMTDINGIATLENLEDGTYELSISYIGHKTQIISIN